MNYEKELEAKFGNDSAFWVFLRQAKLNEIQQKIQNEKNVQANQRREILSQQWLHQLQLGGGKEGADDHFHKYFIYVIINLSQKRILVFFVPVPHSNLGQVKQFNTHLSRYSRSPARPSSPPGGLEAPSSSDEEKVKKGKFYFSKLSLSRSRLKRKFMFSLGVSLIEIHVFTFLRFAQKVWSLSITPTLNHR